MKNIYKYKYIKIVIYKSFIIISFKKKFKNIDKKNLIAL